LSGQGRIGAKGWGEPVAAIPGTGSAQCARHGVVRVLSRAVVLGGMVVAGWLLGSGIGLANEDPGQPGTDVVQLASHPGEESAQAEGGSDGQLGVPPTLGSAITRVCSAVSRPGPSDPPPVQLSVLRHLANAMGNPKPLAQVLNPRVLNPRVLVPRVSVPRLLVTHSRPGKPGAGIRSRAPAEEPATAPRAEPAGRSAAATAPLTTLEPSAVPATVDHAPLAVPLRAAPAERSAGWPAFGDDPATPVPASPPASTPFCMISSTGSGAVTKNAPDITTNDSWATAEAALMYRLRQLAASDLPRSAATQPSTSPD
jgi:hypothetical protein